MKNLLIIIFLLSCGIIYSQDQIITSRPTQSIGVDVLPVNGFQIEHGITFENNSHAFDGFYRVALSEISEIRFFTDYETNKILFGSKVKVRSPDKFPGIALSINLDNDFNLNDYRIVLVQNIKNIAISYNLGKQLNLYNIIAIGVPLKYNLSIIGEFYYEENYQQINTALAYIFKNENQIDVITGLKDYKDAYISIGYSRRFNYKK